MVKKPGFSAVRSRPFKLGPLTKVASVIEARSLRSPTPPPMTATAVLLSFSYLPFREPLIFFGRNGEQEEKFGGDSSNAKGSKFKWF